ncbi:MAG: DinB family protein [Fimbriimonas sp.]
MNSLQEAVARRTDMAHKDLQALIKLTRPDRVDWKPEGAKSVLEIVRECAEVNERWASILRNGKWVGYDPSREAPGLMPTLSVACAHLRTTTGLFVTEVRNFPDERLETIIALPWGEITGETALMHALWHMNYHEGQIGYLQTMYGDLQAEY